VPNHLGSCYSEPKDVAVPELPERQGDGNGGRVIRRLGGRPTTLTPALSEQIIALVRDVGALATAARCAGVPVSVAREWRARGFGNDPNRPRTAVYASFADGVEKARGEFVARRIRRIEQAAEGGTWTADAWAVERVDPDTWGRRDRLDVSGTITVVEMRAFFVAVVGLLERYVPPERLEAELANLIAVTDEIAGGMPDRATTR
jgi:hypothetical protein